MRVPQFLKRAKFKHDLRTLGKHHREIYGVSLDQQFREAWHLHQLNDIEVYEYVDNHFSAPDMRLEEKEKFVSYNQLCWIQRDLNPRAERGILNKWVLYHILTDAGLPRPRVYGLFDPVFGYTTEGDSFNSIDDLRRILDENNLTKFVIKPASGDKGTNVWVFSKRQGDLFTTLAGDKMSMEDLHHLMLEMFNTGMPHRRDGIILQERVQQHDVLQKINPNCTNTLRVITLINNAGEVEVMINQLKFGRGKSMVDNASKGAATSYVFDDGTISRVAVISRESLEMHECHPDTGAQAAGLKLPYYKEAIELAKEAQRRIPQLRSVGWDIAITNDGPMIIEGNTWYGWHPQPRGRKGMICPGLREILDKEIMPKYRGNSTPADRG